MAGATRLATRPSVMPDGFGGFLNRRLIEAAGGLLILGALALALALATYSPDDPSLSHATDAPARNLVGAFGAVAADILLQTLGLGSALFVTLLAAWGWRLARDRRLPIWWVRITVMPLTVVLAAMALSIVPPPANLPLPLSANLGGVVGQLMLRATLETGGGLGLGATALAAGAAFLSATALSFALAVTWGEWRALARTLGWLGRILARATRHALLWWPLRGDPAAERALAKSAQRRDRREPSLRDSDDDEFESAYMTPDAAPDVAPRRPAPTVLVASRAAAGEKKAAQARKQTSLNLPPRGRPALPPLDLLAQPREDQVQPIDEAALTQNARLLESVLEDFGVRGQIVKVRPGPVVTLYELEPAPGTKTSRVIGLADDIARSMSAVSVRVAVIPGRNVIGVELPNIRRETVYLRELLATEASERGGGLLTLVLGKDIGGTPVIADLARMPHLLIAGTTGSGKSVAINTMILSLLYRHGPQDCRFIMIDPKMLELSVYDGIPHLLSPVVTDPKKAIVALKWTVREMENRYRAMSKLGVRNIAGYNQRLAEARKKGEVLLRKVQTGFDEQGKPILEDQALDLEALPFIVVVVDEMADLMLVAGKEIEWAVQRLAQMARAAGIHLIMATQRPSVDVITGTIKANFPTRISFQVTSKIDSRTILGEQGAEQLLGQGDMLYMAGGGRIARVHGPFVSDREVEEVVRFLKAQGEPEYLDDVTEDEDDGGLALLGAASGGEGGPSDALYDQAVALVARERKCSTSFIQRHLQIGYNRAARIVERMEAEGVVSTANHVGKREVLAPKGEYA
ncbi:MAG TPA: DNA translocase FtsK 4TM domain-containing protein [Alphaproteobacteria bacterium]|nr:DNA translocase FtsK 4TM domain-containing protein [Alphaproteobacteria bacterium]